MSKLNLIWRGIDSPTLYDRLSVIIKYSQKTSSETNKGLERLLDDYIQTLFLSHSGVCKIDGQLYWTKALGELHLSIPIVYEGQNIFPSIVLGDEMSYDNILDTMYNVICLEIKDCLNVDVKYIVDSNFIQKSLNIYIDADIEVIKNFERSLVGIFVYLLYLSKKYDTACVLVSELQPLFKKCMQVEADLLSMSKTTFIAKYPIYNKKYSHIMAIYKDERIFTFRIYILITILKEMGPFVRAELVKSKQITGNITNSFKTLFSRCKEEKKRFSIGFAISIMAEGSHGTVIIIDNLEKMIERFDPNGKTTEFEMNAVEIQMDSQLTQFAKENGYFYAPPDTFCPRLGIQQIEQFFESNIGYCVSWSILYAEERLSSSYDRKYVANNLSKIIRHKYNITGKTVEEIASNLQKWIDSRIKEVFEGMRTAFNDLSVFLEVPVNYVDNSLKYNLL